MSEEIENIVTKKDKNLFERFFSNITNFDRFLDQKIDFVLLKIINILRYAFIIVMIMYLAVCLMSLSHKVIAMTINQGVLDFDSIKNILTDGLFILIILAIVKSFFIKHSFDYSITFLEIAFVVLVRKLILLQTEPSETFLLLVLGLTSALFFILIIYVHQYIKKDKVENK
ncbi:conserved hypothetical protein [Arcobacter nitrofigilis DSM 7299]|uniref:Phosphate-starvation-inducible E-like protein n=1 Tax=Arcobacter nitrofigilis (strain ATCC 33309 / DSM 7299 / CCUG 15893 / LMG 7604 / NCTC 12251 / CI) TaxID=572480 RepID=D5V6P9_ARCNC|nr:hypothetical protein [Arcobacter nitrofigilis]ADG94319.1 conserved hypothetical protein [Arcobacter nitrofigilis DSM 7299]